MGHPALHCWLASAAAAALLAVARAGLDLPWASPLFVPKSTAPPSSDSADPRPERPLYAFDYNVNSPMTGDMKSQWEMRDGDVVRGSYTVVQPDGSVLTVEYTADGENGFKAVVKKDGVFVKPTEAPKGFDKVPLYIALKPLLGALPTQPTITTTTAAPSASSGDDGKSHWPFDDIYEKFWKTYGTSIYGRDHAFFDPFRKVEDEKPKEKPTFPFYYHVQQEEPKTEQPYPVYYFVNTKKKAEKPNPGYPYYYYVDPAGTDYSKPKSVDPFYYFLGNKYDKSDLSDTMFPKF